MKHWKISFHISSLIDHSLADNTQKKNNQKDQPPSTTTRNTMAKYFYARNDPYVLINEVTKWLLSKERTGLLLYFI